MTMVSIMHAASTAAKAKAQQLANFTCVHHHPLFPNLYLANQSNTDAGAARSVPPAAC
ncbi:hypothetical protein ACQJBY_061603 [Aegilops geniculata]